MRVVMLTGNGLRHRYVAKVLAQHVDLVGLVSEIKRDPVPPELRLSDDDRRVLAKHFAERDETERKYMGDITEFGVANVVRVPYGGSNTFETFEWIKKHEPDYIALYGTGIIKPPLLDYYENKIVNIHLGLSPYYRGSGTNFWPLVNREPECLGATIHLAIRKVDAGSILAHVRPDSTPGDRAHDLGTKTILKAAEALPKLMRAYAEHRIMPRRQPDGERRDYKRKDFTPDAVRRMWQQFDSGMMQEFLCEKEARYAKYPIITFTENFHG